MDIRATWQAREALRRDINYLSSRCQRIQRLDLVDELLTLLENLEYGNWHELNDEFGEIKRRMNDIY